MGVSWAFSAEELRVLATVGGAALPPILADEDSALAEAVATRSLVAHGLLVIGDEPPLALAPGAAQRLRPLLEADTMAEVELDGRPIQRHVVLGRRDGPKLVMREREPQVWVLDRTEESFGTVLRRLLDDHAPEAGEVRWWDAGDSGTGWRMVNPGESGGVEARRGRVC